MTEQDTAPDAEAYRARSEEALRILQIAGAHVTSPALNAFGVPQARANAQLRRYAQ
jgi:hypothetical protein